MRLVRPAVLCALALTLLGCGDGGPAAGQDALAGMVRTPTPTISVPAISDASGAPVAFPAPAGGLALVYFGYLSCPDICPTSMSDLRWALDQLGPDAAARTATTFVTVDPERDTEAGLAAYIGSFVEQGVGLRVTDPEALRGLADAFGADYRREVADDGTVEVGHTAFLYALDEDGRLLVQWPFGTTRNELRDDLATLLDQLEP